MALENASKGGHWVLLQVSINFFMENAGKEHKGLPNLTGMSLSHNAW